MHASFLFLQGVCSPFFACLALALRQAGHKVAKVNYTVGDQAYWRGGNAVSYRGRAEDSAAFYERQFERSQATDVVLFGDRRPIHRPAVARARERGLRVHVFEEGYFRPHWVTLERGGVNAHSPLPRDPAWYLEAAGRAGAEPARAFAAPFWLRAWHDVAYHSFSAWNPIFYPRYRTHAPYGAAREYGAYVRRAFTLRRKVQEDAHTVAVLAQGRQPYFLLPLQLESDAQIRDHSRYGSMRELVDEVMRSFAQHAPAEALLVVKNHPLDPGFADHGAMVAERAAHYGLRERVRYLESGHLPTVLRHARGVVTVNSTVGTAALDHGCPTLALATPIYALPGLTWQHGLDAFWRDAAPPDAVLYRAFRSIVIHTTQINGGFYSTQGIRLAVRNAVARMTRPRSPLEALL